MAVIRFRFLKHETKNNGVLVLLFIYAHGHLVHVSFNTTTVLLFDGNRRTETRFSPLI